MDYGKLAYLKAEELEARLSTVNSGVRTKFSCQTFALSLSLSHEREIYLTQLQAKSVAAMVVKINACVYSGGDVELLVGGLNVGQATFGVTAKDGASAEGVIVGSVLVDGYASVSIKSANGFVGDILSVDVLAYGDNVSVEGRLSGISLDGADGNFLSVKPVKEAVYFARADSESGVCYGEQALLGRGSKCDCIYLGHEEDKIDEFRVVFCDNQDNLWGVALNGTNSFEYVFLGWHDGVKRVRLVRCGKQLLVGLLIGGRIFYMQCGLDFLGRTSLLETETHIRAEDFGFVKGQGTLSLYFCGEGKSFVKTAVDRSMGNESLKLRITTSIKEVS